MVFEITVQKFPILASDIICLIKDTEYAKARINAQYVKGGTRGMEHIVSGGNREIYFRAR